MNEKVIKEKVRVGYIGLGRRGIGMLQHVFSAMADVEITALCDLIPERMDAAAEMLSAAGLPAPTKHTDYHDLLRNPDIDAIIIMAGWNARVACAIDSMNAGKYTAIEVGCAYNIEECHALIETYERTKTPVMMLENCCYGRREMAALRMAREGLFGDIVLCSGGYHHYLNEVELLKEKEDGTIDLQHYRIAEYMNRNCEQYPTHELGPISKLLNLNRGNRVLSLRSIASGARGLTDYMQYHLPEGHPYRALRPRQSDIVTTILECAGGEQIILTLDTTLPRAYYSRQFGVRGTKGMCQESAGHVCTYFLEGMTEGADTFNNEKEFLKTHDHPLHVEYANQARGGHGGMDWLVGRAFIESVKHGTQTPIDAYDTALWLAIAPLSEASIACGGAPVEVPDFTKGRWFRREEPQPCKYSLDLICSDPDTPIVP